MFLYIVSHEGGGEEEIEEEGEERSIMDDKLKIYTTRNKIR